MSQTFALTDLLNSDAPAAAARFKGLPRYNFVGGHNDPDQIPTEAFAEAAAHALASEGKSLALYNLGQSPLGHAGLRAFVARKSAETRGIKATADDVLITIGSSQGLDLVNQLFVKPGDTVILEALSFHGEISRLRALGANVVAAPVDEAGLRIDALADILRDLKAQGIRPRFIYTIPTIQNPTGSVLPLDRRHALIDLARSYGVAIFEDECYAELTWNKEFPPALYALGPDVVIHIGSFSKTLAPALRLGYVIGPWELLGRLQALRKDASGALEQLIVAAYAEKNYASHVATLKAALKAKLETLVEALEREFGTAVEFQRPDGGIFLWVKLPDQVDVRSLVAPAAKAGIVFNPGPEWAVDPESAKSWLRLCFALPSHGEIEEGIAAFARVVAEETGLKLHSDNRAAVVA